MSSRKPTRMRCLDCGNTFIDEENDPENDFILCPDCNSGNTEEDDPRDSDDGACDDRDNGTPDGMMWGSEQCP